MAHENNGSNFVSFFVGFFFGAIVGGITALLYAPQSGEETRNLIVDKSIELKEKAAATSEEWTKLTQERIEELQKHGQVVAEEESTVVIESGDGDAFNEETEVEVDE
jgi:gas vesicle protein